MSKSKSKNKTFDTDVNDVNLGSSIGDKYFSQFSLNDKE